MYMSAIFGVGEREETKTDKKSRFRAVRIIGNIFIVWENRPKTRTNFGFFGFGFTTMTRYVVYYSCIHYVGVYAGTSVKEATTCPLPGIMWWVKTCTIVCTIAAIYCNKQQIWNTYNSGKWGNPGSMTEDEKSPRRRVGCGLCASVFVSTFVLVFFYRNFRVSVGWRQLLSSSYCRNRLFTSAVIVQRRLELRFSTLL